MLQTFVKLMQEIELIFVRVTTAVVFVAAIYIGVFWGLDCEVGIDLLWQILGTSFLCSIGDVILFFNQECGKWQMLGRRILYFLFVNVIVLGAGFLFSWFYISNMKMIIFMELCIIVVFIIVTVISYFADYKVAEEMNLRLQERNENNE